MGRRKALQPRDPVWDHVKIVSEKTSAKGKPTVECNYCDIKPFVAGRDLSGLLYMLSVVPKSSAARRKGTDANGFVLKLVY